VSPGIDGQCQQAFPSKLDSSSFLAISCRAGCSRRGRRPDRFRLRVRRSGKGRPNARHGPLKRPENPNTITVEIVTGVTCAPVLPFWAGVLVTVGEEQVPSVWRHERGAMSRAVKGMGVALLTWS
jgi:hypothetical protein